MLLTHANTITAAPFRLRYITAGLNRLKKHYGATAKQREENLSAWMALAVTGLAKLLGDTDWRVAAVVATATNRVRREIKRTMRATPLNAGTVISVVGAPYERVYGFDGEKHLIAVSPKSQHMVDLACHTWRDHDCGVQAPDAVCVQMTNPPALMGAAFEDFKVVVVPYPTLGMLLDAQDEVLHDMLVEDARKLSGQAGHS